MKYKETLIAVLITYLYQDMTGLLGDYQNSPE